MLKYYWFSKQGLVTVLKKGDIVIMLSDRALDRCEAYVDKESTIDYSERFKNGT